MAWTALVFTAARLPEHLDGRGRMSTSGRGVATKGRARARKIHDMKEVPMKVTLTEPELAGDYIVVERNPDGSVVLAPDTSIEAIRSQLGTRPMSPEEFQRHFGHLPNDGEG